MKLLGKLKTYSASELEKTRVGIGFECYDRDLFTPEKCYDVAAAMGTKFVRVQTGWARTEKEKGVYDFSWLDDMVDNLISRGMIPWFNVGFGNPIYMDDVRNSTAVGCVPIHYGEECLKAWINYVKAMTQHYKDRITYFEIWNECDISHFWYPKTPNAEELATLIKITGDAIKEVKPEAQIGTCLSNTQPDYFYKLFTHLSPENIDFYCCHNYDRYPEKSIRTENHAMARRIMNELGFEKVKMWMGECGHASWHPVGHGQCKAGGGNEYRQAIWHLRRVFHDLKDGMELTSLFMIVDLWEKPYEKAVEVLTKPAAQGLLHGITYTPKLTVKGVTNAATVLSGDNEICEPFGRIVRRFGVKNEDTLNTTVNFKHNGKKVMAYWLTVPIEEEPVKDAGCFFPMNPMHKIKEPVCIDMLTGEVYERESLEEAYPIKEYPMLICEKDAYEFE